MLSTRTTIRTQRIVATTMAIFLSLLLLCSGIQSSNGNYFSVVTGFTPSSTRMKMNKRRNTDNSHTIIDHRKWMFVPTTTTFTHKTTSSIPRMITMISMKNDIDQERNNSAPATASTVAITTTTTTAIQSMIRSWYTLTVATWLCFVVVVVVVVTTIPLAATAVDDTAGASSAANAKLTTGGASTLQSGRTISITRGVNLDNSNFANQNLKGVAFQQSVVRDTDFSNSNLYGASFFDATVDGSNFNNADMTMANIEMAQFNRASMKNTVAREMYVSGATLFEGIIDIEGSDWTDTYLRADQQKYLCAHPTAKGINPKTGISTRESLLCKD